MFLSASSATRSRTVASGDTVTTSGPFVCNTSLIRIECLLVRRRARPDRASPADHRVADTAVPARMALVTTVLEAGAEPHGFAAVARAGRSPWWYSAGSRSCSPSTPARRSPSSAVLGVATWCVLVGLLVREAPLVRAQTAIVVVFASLVEYTFSPFLGVYLYRFHNVPAYVPPGHGLVYLAALAIGRTRLGPRARAAAWRSVSPWSAAAGRRTACCSRADPTCSARSGSSACWRS